MTAGQGLRIGVSAAFMHADPQRALFKGKTLKYVEQELVHWIMLEGALPYMIPSPMPAMPVDLTAYARDLDGLVLQGGADLAPQSYGEEPLRPEWAGDRVRDAYELSLLHVFVEQRKPVFGVCRGLQLINVAMGGALFQDIATQVPEARVHRDWNIYDQNFHDIRFESGTRLQSLFPDQPTARVCSVHHQGIKRLGENLVIEARSSDDGVIEAIRHTGPQWLFGVQWHPEWHAPGDPTLLDSGPLIRDFLAAAHARKREASAP